MKLDKLTMAHEWYMKNSNGGSFIIHDVKSAWQYADAMQAEADKRKSKPELPSLQQTFIDGVEQPRYAPPCEEWQPDWSQAPSRMNYYFMNRDGGEYWTVNKPDEPNMTEHVMEFRACGGDCYAYASSQNYQGKWQKSLRKCPQ